MLLPLKISQKRPKYMKKDPQIKKETSINAKRPTCMKRNLHTSKENHVLQSWRIPITLQASCAPCTRLKTRTHVLVCVCVCVCVCACVCVCVCEHTHAHVQTCSNHLTRRGGGLGSRPKKMYGERLGMGSSTI